MRLTRPELIFLAGILIFAGGCGERSTTSENSHPPALEEAQPSEAPPELPLPTPTTQTAEPPLQSIPPLVAKQKAEDQATLGMKYAKGDGVPVDLKEAFRLFTLSAEAGSPSGQYFLGAAYSHGKGVEKDDKTAFKWCLESAKQGHVKAQVFVGEMYDKGQGVQQDDSEAFRWFERAAKQDDPEAQSHVGGAYLIGKGVTRDNAKAAESLEKAAQQGDAQAQSKLGSLYEAGVGVEIDLEVAAEWNRRAAEQNDADAQIRLGKQYQTGRGMPKDEAQAIFWFRKAAEQSLVEAQWRAALLLSATSETADRVEAHRWWRAAAEQGNALSQFILGNAYEVGRFEIKDIKKAVHWYTKAAEQGDSPSQFNLALLYLSGEGVPKNESAAADFLVEAASRGNRDAQLELGIWSAKGIAMPVNDVEAYKWFLLAQAGGHPEAKPYVATAEQHLTATQRKDGQARAREFTPRSGPLNSTWTPPEVVAANEPTSTGSGFFITESGYFITNYHVTKDAREIRLVTKAGTIQAKLISADPANDLVLLKAEGLFTPLPVTPSRNVRLGTTVATVGFPNISLQGQSPKLAKGEIASLAGVQDDARWFQISVPVQPGNSGGPLVDDLGNVVGVIVAKLSQKSALATTGTLAENVNYAIKSSFLLSFLEATPDASSGLIEAVTKPREFEEIVTETEKGSALVLVY